MFDLTSSKLLILAVVALIVVGPKDLPVLLRTLGKYMGMIRRQANEFRAQFEDAMRETELSELKKEVEELGRDTRDTLRKATQSVETQLGDVTRDVNQSLSEIDKPGMDDKPAGEPGLPSPEPTPALTADAEDRALLPDATGGNAGLGTPSEPSDHAPHPSPPPAAEPKAVAEAGAPRSGA